MADDYQKQKADIDAEAWRSKEEAAEAEAKRIRDEAEKKAQEIEEDAQS